MSDLCMYELEDNVWDEFGDSDDHIVPHTVDEYWDQLTVQGDSRKKPRHVIRINPEACNVAKYGISGEEKRALPTLIKDTMLEKGSWSDTPEGVFPASCDNDSHKEVTSITSDDARLSGHDLKNSKIDSVGSEFCDDPILVDKCASEDNNVYRYPLNQISETGDDLSFFNNDREDKGSDDLLYYGWPDIGNFEDVDRMFRSCDSTFGLGNLSTEDDFWFSSSHAADGSENALEPNTKLSSMPAHYETSRPDSAGPSTIDSKRKSVIIIDKTSSRTVSGDDADLSHLSSMNAVEANSESKNELLPDEQISLLKKQSKQRSQSGERKDRNLENGRSFHCYGNMKQPYSGNSASGIILPSGLQQQHKQSIRPDSLSCMQPNVPYMHRSYDSPTLSGTNSENNGYPPPTKESSYASNQVQSMESSHCPSYVTPTIMKDENRGIYHKQDVRAPFNRKLKYENMENQMACHNAATVEKQVHPSEQDEGHSEVDGISIGIPAELDSSNAQESSCVSSVLDEVSLEASSFRQLQQVMEQLDIRTKLCIRDSLYRLARSAEQRHNCASRKDGFRDDRDASGSLMAEGPNKCTGFMDMETDTNPIDRSIAHLLFHRPSDPSLKATTDNLPLKSHGMQ